MSDRNSEFRTRADGLVGANLRRPPTTQSEVTAKTDGPVGKKKSKIRLVIIPIVTLVILGGGFTTWLYIHNHGSLVPKSIQKVVDFPVYYPDPKKLPAGYTLDLSSFSVPVKNGVTYKVNYGIGNSVVFSLQPKVSSNEYKNFEGSYLSLHTTYQTAIGQAEVGAYNLKTLVSLQTTNSNVWIIITAPGNINQSQLDRVLSSIEE